MGYVGIAYGVAAASDDVAPEVTELWMRRIEDEFLCVTGFLSF
jgi:hypothetical protein